MHRSHPLHLGNGSDQWLGALLRFKKAITILFISNIAGLNEPKPVQ
jgi:hypothetical protein